MMEARHISFGLTATAVAMAALQGRCTDARRLDLVYAALDTVADDAEAREAVKTFVVASRTDLATPEFDWQRRADCNG